MRMTPQDKALLITFSGAAFLVLLFFFLGVSPYPNKIEEKFFDVPIIDETLEPEEQLLAEKEVKSDEPISHLATNTSRLQGEVNRFFSQEDEVREALESEAQPESEDDGEDTEMTDYKSKIAALREKASQPKSSGDDKSQEVSQRINTSTSRRTTISYQLKDRDAIKIPNPVYTCDATGKVVINIEVGGSGNVTKVSFNKSASSTSNGCLVDQAIEYAKKAIFNNASIANQLGTITFEFQG